MAIVVPLCWAALALTIAVVPGVSVGESGAVLLAAVVLGLLGAVLRPAVAALLTYTGWAGVLGGWLLGQAVLVYGALSVTPGLEVHRLPGRVLGLLAVRRPGQCRALGRHRRPARDGRPAPAPGQPAPAAGRGDQRRAGRSDDPDRWALGAAGQVGTGRRRAPDDGEMAELG
ncbi:phage holin family protein [Pseudosporangium ferrugineum]|uniref:phage holin family protein n=1 Tax=Pseudosporangium ferrugineum TaxID=439699 RepID=UPI001FE45C22|nr:phage holin family protein [Pseudosporangium ferrugineum]